MRAGKLTGETERRALKMALASIGCCSTLNETVGQEQDDVIGGEGNGVFPVAGPGRRTDARCRREAGDVSFDLVIGSDVIYSSTIVEPLFSTVDSLLSRGFTPKQSKTVSEVAGEYRSDSRGGYTAGASTSPSSFPIRPCLGPDNSKVCPSGDALGESDRENNAVTTMTPPPVFIMSQSFAYDVDTEEAIDFACTEHGLEREIVWDHLKLAPTTSRAHQDGREGFIEIGEGSIITEQSDELEDGGLDKPIDGRRSAATRGCRLLLESTRPGTKLQLFRRSLR